jgi:hypothetical protein
MHKRIINIDSTPTVIESNEFIRLIKKKSTQANMANSTESEMTAFFIRPLGMAYR